MNRARVSLALLSVLVWHVAEPCFIAALPAPVAQGQAIAAAHEAGDSAWVPSSTQTMELVNAIRDHQLRPRLANHAVTLIERAPREHELARVVRAHRSPYPALHRVRLRLSRSENGDPPH